MKAQGIVQAAFGVGQCRGQAGLLGLGLCCEDIGAGQHATIGGEGQVAPMGQAVG